MKKFIYLLLAMLTATPIMATQQVTTSLIIASTLLVSSKKFDKSLSLDLHKAVEKKDHTLVKKLINNPKVDVNAKVDYYGDVDKGDISCGNTALLYCCKKGDQWLETAKALLEHDGINVNLKNNNGITPLMMCYLQGDKSLEIGKLPLKRKNSNVKVRDVYFTKPLNDTINYKPKQSYNYVKLWNTLVTKGATLKRL